MKRSIAAALSFSLLIASSDGPLWAQRAAAVRAPEAELPAAPGPASAAAPSSALSLENTALPLLVPAPDPKEAPALLPVAAAAASAAAAPAPPSPPAGEAPGGLAQRVAELGKSAAPAMEAAARPETSSGGLYSQGESLSEILLGRRPASRPESAPVAHGNWSPSASPLSKPGSADRPRRRIRIPEAAAAFAGMALPMGIMPKIFAAALLITAVSAFLIFDYLSGYGLLRRVYWSARQGPSRDAVERNLRPLLGLREADEKPVRDFIAAWLSAKPEERPALLAFARRNHLGRPMLLAAYLAQASREGGQALLAELSASAADGEPLDPLLGRLIEQRKTLAWLGHPKGASLLAPLAARLDPRDAGSEALLKELAAENGAGRRRPALRAAALLLLTALVSVTTLAGVYTVQYGRERTAAEQKTLLDFWGEEYAYLFRDDYRDDATGLLQSKVVPALKGWNRLDEGQEESMREAIEILHRLPHPKTDNFLRALLDRIDHLPPGAQTSLLQTLVERDNPAVWERVLKYMRSHEKDPKAADRLFLMIDAGAEAGKKSDAVLLNLFYFLKSPDAKVQRRAAEKISSIINEPERTAGFLPMMTAASERHRTDPALQLYLERFLLDRLSLPGARDLETAPTDALFGQILNSLPPDQLERALIVLESVLDRFRHSGRTPDPLTVAVQFQAHRLARGLIAEGKALYPLLAESLTDKGVLNPVPAPPPRRMLPNGTPAPPVPDLSLPETYTLSQLRELDNALKKSAQDPDLTDPQLEYMDRAGSLAERLLAVAEKAGIPEGGTPGEQAAESINRILDEGLRFFAEGDDIRLHDDLRKGGIIYDVRFTSWEKERIYRQSYDPEGVEKVRLVLADLLQRGRGTGEDGNPRPIGWPGKRHIADMLALIEAAREEHYPGLAKTAGDRPSESVLRKSQFEGLRDAIIGRDPKAIDRAEAALADAFDKAWSKDLFLSQLAQAQVDSNTHAEFQLWALRFLADALAGPHASLLDKTGAKEAVDASFDIASNLLIGEALTRHPELPPRLLELGVLRPKTHFNYGQDRDIAQDFGGAALRDSYGLAHLRRLRSELSHFPGEEPALASLDAALKAGAAAGVREGGTTAERVADELNYLLAAGEAPFPEGEFLEALHKAGLAPGTDAMSPASYPPGYAPQDLARLHDFLNVLLEKDEKLDGSLEPLDHLQRRYLADALEYVDLWTQKFYPDDLGLVPATLGRLMQGLQDPATRPAAEKAVDDFIQARPVPILVVSRLAAAQTRYASDPELQRWLAGRLIGLTRDARGEDFADQPGVGALWRAAGEPWDVLKEALDRPSPAMRRFALERITEAVNDTVRINARKYYNQRDLINIRAWRLLEVGKKAGMLPGDTRGEWVAAAQVNPWLFRLHNQFGGGYYQGQFYINALRRAKLAPALSPARIYPVDVDVSFFHTYSAQDLRALADFHQKILDSGMGWNPVGAKALTPQQKIFLRNSIWDLKQLANSL